jgi:uncharacterized membrane protein
MKNNFSIPTSLVVISVLVVLGCKHDKPLPEISNTPIKSYNCSSDTVYFQNDIAPILISNCSMSGCHNSIDHAEGIDVSNYVALMNSDIINRLHANRSEIMESLNDSGDDLMPPPPYSPLSSTKKALIEKWINQGAINNQCMECDTTLNTFSQGVWPIIAESCQGCHLNGNSGNGNVALNNYTDVSTDTNLLIDCINGNNGVTLMPLGSSGLTDCEKQIIQNWINNGALNN